MGTGLEIAALTIMAGASAYQGYEAYKSRKATEEQAQKAEDEAAKLEEQQMVNEESAAMQVMKNRKKSSSSSARDTVLTGSLGLIGQPQTANKTLLGA